jgi:hypothetical protein
MDRLKRKKESSVKELNLTWKKLAVIIPLVASILTAIIAGIFSYVSSLSNSKTNNSNAAISTCAEQVNITAPADMQMVNIPEMIHGTYQNLPPDEQIWVLLKPSDVGKYYPQDHAEFLDDSRWICSVSIGLGWDAGKTFYIYAVLADRRTQAVLNDYVKQAKDKNDSPGIADLPKGVQICQYVKVIRK